MPDQKQHVQFHRKLELRRRMLHAALPGAAYVPYCGDGDLAAELYTDRDMLGCVDAERLELARQRLPAGTWVEHDADTFFAGPRLTGPGTDNAPINDVFAVADFDAYSYPYACFRDFWAHARKAPRLVMFFTDGQRHTMFLNSTYTDPEGEKVEIPKDGSAKQTTMQRYLKTILEPWLAAYIDPWRITNLEFYSRGQMLYWGATVDAPADANVANVDGSDVYLFDQSSYKFDGTAKRRLVDLIASGTTRSEACRAVGINLRTLERHLKRYPAFERAYRDAMEVPDDEVERSLYLAAASGHPGAQRFWLVNRRPDQWADKQRVQLTVQRESLEELLDILKTAGIPREYMLIVQAEIARRMDQAKDA